MDSNNQSYSHLPTYSPQPPPTTPSDLTIHGDDFDDTVMLTSSSPPSPSSRLHKPLPLKQKLGYSVGHVLNDLCSAIWFSYLLVYMTLVLSFSSAAAGVLLLVGQIADGAATPLVGIFSDKFSFGNYGRKKFWHLLGSIAVLLSFPLIFNPCVFNCDNSSTSNRLAYYSIFISLFQFGWAATQVSHLSLIPDLTPISNERVGLNSLRYSWTVISSITVYIITWLVLSVDESTSTNTNDNNNSTFSLTNYLSQESHHWSSDEISNKSLGDSTIGPTDAPKFRILIISILSLGAFFTLLFHLIVDETSRSKSNNNQVKDNDEPQSTSDEETNNQQNGNTDQRSRNVEDPHLKWWEWFSVPQFYSLGVLYMGTRLVINITQVYIPFYLHFTLNLRKQSIAYIPLVMYCASFIASLATKYLDRRLGKRLLYAIGCIMSAATYTWMYLSEGSFYRVYGIFFVVILLGFSGAIMLVISLGLTNDLIGHNTSSGAFVFGAMSFLDKVSNGIAVMVIQKLHPTDSPSCAGHVEFYRDVLSFVCGSATLLAIFGLLLIIIKPLPTDNHQSDKS